MLLSRRLIPANALSIRMALISHFWKKMWISWKSRQESCKRSRYEPIVGGMISLLHAPCF